MLENGAASSRRSSVPYAAVAIYCCRLRPGNRLSHVPTNVQETEQPRGNRNSRAFPAIIPPKRKNKAVSAKRRCVELTFLSNDRLTRLAETRESNWRYAERLRL